MRDPRHRRRRGLIALAMFAIVCYSAWIAAPLLGHRLDPVHTYVSELAALDQDLGAVYRACDAVAGLAFVALGALLLRGAPAAGRWRRWGMVALIVLGVGTVADSIFPLACAPHVDAVCRAAEEARDLPFTHWAHTGASVIAGLGIAGVLVAWCVDAWRTRQARSPLLTGAFCAVGGLSLVGHLLSSVAEVLNQPVGIPQRLALALLAVFVPWGVALRDSSDAPSGTATSP